jgi:hypothetical protein
VLSGQEQQWVDLGQVGDIGQTSEAAYLRDQDKVVIADVLCNVPNTAGAPFTFEEAMSCAQDAQCQTASEEENARSLRESEASQHN